MKIGILSLPIKTNYGAILQVYALQTVLKQLGHDAWFIKRRWNSNKQSVPHKISKWVYHHTIIRKFNNFINKYIEPQTEVIDTPEKVKSLLYRGFDGFVVGSDQIWRMKNVYGADYNYFLDFAADADVRRVSYAASFGVDYWDDTKPDISIPIVKSLLQKFDGISVREDSGVDVCKDVFNVEATHVLDPTLLLTKEEYIRNFGLKISTKHYIGVYILDMNVEKKNMIERISESLGIPVIYINMRHGKEKIRIPEKISELAKPGVKEWIKGIAEAELVVTDSFHGTAFSIIFEKQFLTIGNVERGLTRFQSLLNSLGIIDKLVLHPDDVCSYSGKIDYEAVNTRKRQLQEDSVKFLKHNLNEGKAGVE